jgi:hypothetical protein
LTSIVPANFRRGRRGGARAGESRRCFEGEGWTIATNLDEQEGQAERDRALGELRAQRVAKVAEIAQLGPAIGKLEDEDFMQCVGSVTPRQVSIREKCQ